MVWRDDEPDEGMAWMPDFPRLQRLVEQAAHDADIEADIRITPDPHRAPRPPALDGDQKAYLTDLWLIVMTLQVPLSMFFSGFMGEAGKDAYVKLKRLVGRAKSAPGEVAQAVGELQVRSARGGPSVEMDPSLPDEALESLCAIDWDAFDESAVLRWSEDRREWVLGA
jgi:hypothetical protein